jgi:hypothetical protein
MSRSQAGRWTGRRRGRSEGHCRGDNTGWGSPRALLPSHGRRTCVSLSL